MVDTSLPSYPPRSDRQQKKKTRRYVPRSSIDATGDAFYDANDSSSPSATMTNSPHGSHNSDLERQPLSNDLPRGSNDALLHGQKTTRSEQQTTKQSRRSDHQQGAEKSDPFLVRWSEDDDEHPRNWPNHRKWRMVSLACGMELAVSIASSAYSSAQTGIEEEFGVSDVAATVGISLFLLGLGLGAVFLAPISEQFGRNSVYWISFFVFAIFQLPVALAPNFGTILVSRFLSGFAGSVPLTVTGGTCSDVFSPDTSGLAVALFALMGTTGPALGPVISGYIDLKKGWRWIFWVQFILWMSFWLITLLFMRETKASILIRRRAAKIRKETGDSRYTSLEEREQKTYLQVFWRGIKLPATILVTESIVMSMALYNGWIYALLYSYFEIFPSVFMDRHGFNSGELGLCYIPVIIGSFLAFLAHHFQNRYYLSRKAKNNGKSVPEARLAWALIGGPIFAASLFWWAFTIYPQTPWPAPVLSGIPFGFGLLVVYMSCVSFVTESYQTDGASALAAVSFLRSLMGAAFPLFTVQWYENMGFQYAGLLIALLAVLMSFLAPLFFFYGPWVRKHSPHFKKLEAHGAS